MFFTLLAVTFLVALGVSALAARAFDRSIGTILSRIIADDISGGWQRFVRFAILVVGISGGVRIYDLERYIAPERPALAPGEAIPPEAAWRPEPLDLTPERWTLEVYRTVIGSLQSIAWTLLVFFVVALIAYVVVRWAELRREPPASSASGRD